jgi:hypothetical protein
MDTTLEKPDDCGNGHYCGRSERAWGLLKEAFAGGAALTKAAADPNANALIKAVVADFSTSEGRSAARDGLKADFAGGKPANMKTKSVEELRQVSALLNAKAPADAPAFKAWLCQISQSTAEAASEGGSLFGGGVQVSDMEKATLAEISSALGV